MTQTNPQNKCNLDEEIKKNLEQGISGKISTNDFFNIPNSIHIETSSRINKDSDISKEHIEDRKSNRGLRERIARRIFLMMIVELGFTGLLVFSLFFVPFINSLGPQITINVPPFKPVISIIILGTFVLCAFSPRYAALFVKDKNEIKNWHRFIKFILQIVFIFSVLMVLNIDSTKYVINFKPLTFENDMVHWLLILAETIFVKTTILGGMIIKGLFDVIKNDMTDKD